MKVLVEADPVIHIDKSDFCTECGAFIGRWFTKCDECRKKPITFAEGLERK